MNASDNLSPLMRVAVSLSRVLPRGKGAVPRAIGRHLSARDTHYIRTRQGALLAVEPTSLDVYAYMVNVDRTWNWHVLAGCAALLRPGNTFYDIGANVGFMSIELLQIFRATPQPLRVIAFEPLPALANAIRTSARMNNVELQVRGEIVGEHVGSADLFLGSHSIHASIRAREDASQVLTLPATTIDSLVERGEIPRPHVIKIDIEGAEFAAFKGAARTIADHTPSIIFESDENTGRFSYTRRDVLDFLCSLGPYRFFEVAKEAETTAFEPLRHTQDAIEHPADVLATTLSDEELNRANEAMARWSPSRFVSL